MPAKKQKRLIIASIFGFLILVVGAFFLGRISVERELSEPKHNLPIQKPDDGSQIPNPIPGNRKEGKFDYVNFFKEGDANNCIFRNIREGVNPQDWKVIYVNENHPRIKELLKENKLQKIGKQFTIRYGKLDKEENIFLTFNEFNQELEIVEA